MIMSQYAFTDLGMRRLEAHVFAPNAASARVLEKCGFSLDGILRSGATDREGKVEDYLLYAKLARPSQGTRTHTSPRRRRWRGS
ncbi:MAG: GNAT family N-acetyltransferase [bacterium]|nr:GNAT family N-acetyltransferase [bacterium]